MSLNTIRKAYKDFKKNEMDLTFTEPEICVLLTAISTYLLNQSETEKTAQPSSDYIPLHDFTDKYLFVAPRTMLKYCQERDDFHAQCAIKHNRRWYIHETKALEFLTAIPQFKNRIDRGFFKEIMSQ